MNVVTLFNADFFFPFISASSSILKVANFIAVGLYSTPHRLCNVVA